jgi:hypothetical protein
MDSASTGRTESIYYHTHDGHLEGPLFQSWRAQLEDLASRLESGRFKVEHESVWLSR